MYTSDEQLAQGMRDFLRALGDCEGDDTFTAIEIAEMIGIDRESRMMMSNCDTAADRGFLGSDNAVVVERPSEGYLFISFRSQ